MVNLNSSEVPPTVPFDPTNPESYNRSSTSTTVYDSLGNAHTQTMYFRKTAANAWDQYTYIGGNQVGAANTMTFDTAGNLTSSPTVPATPYDPGNGAAPINLTLDFTGTTQYGQSFGVNNISQDGYTSGRLAGVDIDTDGVIFARYTNGQSAALGKVALAKFNNQQGLRQIGNSNWSESFESGTPQLGEAGTSSFGQIQSGALESSNVDIAAQLVNLITAQRNFQANAEVISTADSATQTVINIR
jgi:flagellar hook protein FlgE